MNSPPAWAVVLTSGGVFTFAAAVVTGVFMWARNAAESAYSVAQGAEVLLKQMMAQRETDMKTIKRQELILATVLSANQSAQKWMNQVSQILADHGFDEIPAVPKLLTSVADVPGHQDEADQDPLQAI